MSTIKSITEAVIYTLENGAETIYIREPGDNKHKEADGERGFDLHAQLMEDQLWGNIRRAAKTNPVLKQAMDEIVLIYTLSK